MTETATTPTWPDFLKAMLDHTKQGLITTLSGKVVSYDRASQRAAIQPTTKLPVPLKNGTFRFETPPEIPNCKVLFPRPRGVVFHYDLVAGEGVLIICTIFSIEQFLRTGEVSEPGDIRTHVLSNGVVIPGLDVDADVMTGLESGLQMGLVGGPPIFMTGSEIKVGSTSASAGAARDGDAVQVTIPAGSVIVAVSGGTLNAAPILLDGTIQNGSVTVKIAD